MQRMNRDRAKEQAEADAKLAGLTVKEREVLEEIAAGKTNRDIAEELGLSLRAV
jgi:FixJ family two-component response regulator